MAASQSHQRLALGLRVSETVRQTVLWAEDLYFCNLSGADLSDLDLTGKSFVGCVLSGCSFSGSKLDGARFRTCVAASDRAPSLVGASCVDTRVENCNFSVPDGAIHLAWGDESDAILAAAATGTDDAFADICFLASWDGDPDDEAATFFAAHSLYAESSITRRSMVEEFGAELARRADPVGEQPVDATADALVALVALRAGDPDSYVHHEAFTAVEAMKPGQRAIDMLCSLLHCPDRAILLDALNGIGRLLARFDWGDCISNPQLLDTLERVEKTGDANLIDAVLDLWCDQLQMHYVRDPREVTRLSGALTRLLDHADPWIRINSLRVLRSFVTWDGGKDDIAVLLSDSLPDVREKAWQTLYYRSNHGADRRSFLLEHPPSPEQRASIVSEEALRRKSGRPSVLGTADELNALVHSPDPESRRHGVFFLGLIQDPVLLAHLADSDARVRLEALNAVAACDIPEAANAIEPLLRDPDPYIRSVAERVLAASRP